MTKPVSLANETYRRLKQRKRPGESFSDTIERLMREQKKDPLSFVDRVSEGHIPAAQRLKEIQRQRDASWEDA